ncbi:alpha/beta fold hydrolase [Mucilaginibacter sp. PAMB04168]|uniref:alpha/beta hydrolase family protein n=1 Tax=Mucilaginibacter sp. PAMB04168 TaxID=3138567 RepID=UPI0031F6F337
MMVVHHSDGATNKAFDFTYGTAKITIILLPAMGTRAILYKKFADNLKTAGFNVIAMDWRGSGHSSVRPGRKVNFGYERLIFDVKDLVEQAELHFPSTTKIIIGHSLGGQIAALFASRFHRLVSSIILITSCNVYYKGWRGKEQLKVFLAGCTFYRLANVCGYFPGYKIGFAGNEARMVMKDWCSNALTGKYNLSESAFNYDEALHNLSIPVLALSVKEDKLATYTSVINLVNKFPTAPLEHMHLDEITLNVSPLNHFSWLKKPDALAKLISEWLSSSSPKSI